MSKKDRLFWEDAINIMAMDAIFLDSMGEHEAVLRRLFLIEFIKDELEKQ